MAHSTLTAFHWRLAEEMGAATLFNPSPWRVDFPWRAVQLHTVIVNENEAQAWLGHTDFPEGLRLERVIVTRGAESTLGLTRREKVIAQPPAICVIDTVGAGDAFAGAYAVALAEGRSFSQALEFANIVGALTTQKAGAQEAMPQRVDVDRAMNSPDASSNSAGKSFGHG